ncbi:ATP-grasp domain-containing protein [Sphingobacterium spiritivorum]|uniref:ATP-grasp domain-containing protein n=1 Tax=Sphingobacterium spiritivorum TaxID=258 RepID=UPI003DA35FC0
MRTFVCLSSYYKGYDFMDECKKLGNTVILITSESLKDKNWPWHAIDEVYYMPETEPSVWNSDHMIQGFAYLMKIHIIDTVIALDDFDVEKAALIRETFRIQGMGQTTYRYFRDKLAMRQMAKDSGIHIPPFVPVFNDAAIAKFMEENPAPWVLKPRSEASASGIRKIHAKEGLWQALDDLNEDRIHFLLEVFKPGDVFHVDCLVYDKEIKFISCSQYLSPPMAVSHDGGIFRTRTLAEDSEDFKQLEEINHQVLSKFGIVHGTTHSEFIKSNEDGKFYFLETSCRVGGAHIADMVEAATDVNLWREWVKIETMVLNKSNYHLSYKRKYFAGLIIALAKDKYPDITDFRTAEFVKSLNLEHHISLLYQSDSAEKISKALDSAAEKIYTHHLSILPPQAKPVS